MPEDEVHVWIVDLTDCPAEAPAHLGRQELERAARFHFERDRRRFLASHAALRLVLSAYLKCEAREIRFELEPSGKPRVAGIEFNLSHSHDLALVAVAEGTAVGVDVEHAARHADAAAIASRYFPPGEAARVLADPNDFLRLWTRREAWLKAEGAGLAGIGREQPAAWTVTDLDPAPHYLGAVAFRGDRPVRMRRFTGCQTS